MSEYQYYEFVALDKALTKTQMQYLRRLSSRAEISSTRFANEYNYGNFRGDENALMQRYFDAMVYVANWGTHRFMVRLPSDLVDRARFEAYCAAPGLSMDVKGQSVVLDFCSDPEDYGDWEQGEGWLSSLMPLRAELINGDLRALYLGWLVCAQSGECEEDTLEPPVPPGLNQLSAALECLGEYLRIDPDLLAVAARRSAESVALPAGLEPWVAALPESEKNALLVKLVEGQDPQLGARLLQRYRASVGLSAGAAAAERRCVAELLEVASQHRKEREQAEARQKAEARAKYLDELAPREAAIWQHIEQLADQRQGSAYGKAVDLLKTLQEMAVHQGKHSQFQAKLDDVCHRHQKKRALIDRIKKARLQ